MKELLETLIKEKGLWGISGNLETMEVEYSDGYVNIQWWGKSYLSKGIWHIDTLRDVCRAKWSDKEVCRDCEGEVERKDTPGFPVIQAMGGMSWCPGRCEAKNFTPAWNYHLHKLTDLESPQEREEYLLSN